MKLKKYSIQFLKQCVSVMILCGLLTAIPTVAMEAPEIKSEKSILAEQIEYDCGKTKIILGYGNIVEQQFSRDGNSAIVNAANAQLNNGDGVTGEIFTAAGFDSEGKSKLEKEIEKIPKRRNSQYFGNNEIRLDVGEADITSACDLCNKNQVTHIIHALGPNCNRSEQEAVKEELLEKTYKSILTVAKEHKIRKIALVAISTAWFGYDAKEAAKIACPIIINFIKKNPGCFNEIRLVMFKGKPEFGGKGPGEESYEAYKGLLPQCINSDESEQEKEDTKAQCLNSKNTTTQQPVKKSFLARYKKPLIFGGFITATFLCATWLWYNKR